MDSLHNQEGILLVVVLTYMNEHPVASKHSHVLSRLWEGDVGR